MENTWKDQYQYFRQKSDYESAELLLLTHDFTLKEWRQVRDGYYWTERNKIIQRGEPRRRHQMVVSLLLRMVRQWYKNNGYEHPQLIGHKSGRNLST